MTNGPLIDDKNPFYCPAIPAAVYLQSLRCRPRTTTRSSYLFPSVSQSFTTVLEESFQDAAVTGESQENIGSDWVLGDYFTSGRGWFSSPLDDLPPYSPHGVTRAHSREQAVGFRQEKGNPTVSALSINQRGVKRKSLFSDFGAPPKYARSVQSVHESSFDIELRREQLFFSDMPSSPRMDVELLRTLERLENDMIFLIEKLDAAMPGIRLRSRLWELKNETPQALMDFLAHNGSCYVPKTEYNLQVLQDMSIKLLWTSSAILEFTKLSLLLPCSKKTVLISALRKYTQVEDYASLLAVLDFVSYTVQSWEKTATIIYSPKYPSAVSTFVTRTFDIYIIFRALLCYCWMKLESQMKRASVHFTLRDRMGFIDSTVYSVFLLVPLKVTLTRLSLAHNIDINEDAVPAILLLLNLSFLSIVDTSIGMNGLRRLAELIHKYDRLVDIEIPFVCEDYVDSKWHLLLAFLPR